MSCVAHERFVYPLLSVGVTRLYDRSTCTRRTAVSTNCAAILRTPSSRASLNGAPIGTGSTCAGSSSRTGVSRFGAVFDQWTMENVIPPTSSAHAPLQIRRRRLLGEERTALTRLAS